MSIISAIYDGIKTVLDANLPANSARVYTDWPDNPVEYPAIIAMPFTIPVEDLTFDDQAFQLVIPIDVRVMSASQAEALDKLWEYASATGANSLRAALNNDKTLDGSVNGSFIIPQGSIERDAEDQGEAHVWRMMFDLTVIK